MNARPSFDLLRSPWIRVRRLSGESDELSLIDAFAQAESCSSLAGELPTQDFAVLRLMIAILRRSHASAHGVEDWGDLFNLGRVDTAAVEAYLQPYAERFDLLHCTTPFYQVAGLSTAKGAMSELSKLIPDVPAGHAYFTTRAGPALEAMPFAEAARWIVHCQAFDPSGIKSGAVGDERVKGGKGYPIGVGWCGNLGGVQVEGSTFFETLMLNLRLSTKRTADDLPVWERPPPTAASVPREPTGPLDLLTWQSRRIRLDHDGEQATGVLIANGDALHPRNRMNAEAMTNWRFSEPQTKTHGDGNPVFMPLEHRPDRQVWRGLGGILAAAAPPSTAAHRPPDGGWLDWLAKLRDDEIIPSGQPLRVRAIAVHYGAQNSVIDDIGDDALSLRAAVLGDRRLRVLAVDAVHDADTAARLLAGLAAELGEAAGVSGEGVDTRRSHGREETYDALDGPYRRWLAELVPGDDTDSKRLAWQHIVIKTTLEISRSLVEGAGPSAWIGREVTRFNDRVVYLDAALADVGFRRRLREAFPQPDDQPNPAPHEGKP